MTSTAPGLASPFGRFMVAVGALGLMVVFVFDPTLALLAGLGAVGLFLAWISPAIPLGLAGLAAWFAPLTGVTPPPNATVLLLALWVAAAIVFTVSRDRNPIAIFTPAWTPVILALLLAALLVLRLADTPDPEYGQQKTLLFLLGSLLFVAAAVLCGRDRGELEIVIWLTAGVATLAAVALLLQLASGLDPVAPGRFSLEGTDSPIELGQQASIGILVATYFILARRDAARTVALAALPVLGVALVASGSRGPIMGLIAGMIVLVLLLRRGQELRASVPLAAGAAAALGIMLLRLTPDQSSGRLTEWFTGSAGEDATNGRAGLWGLAWDQFTSEPLGALGTGGFASVGNVADARYPHNFFLEAATELGILGLLVAALTMLFGFGLVAAVFRRARTGSVGVTALLAAWFVASATHAQFSGDLSLNPQMWLALGLLSAAVLTPELGSPASTPPTGQKKTQPAT